jgi:type IV secretion system protein VirB10
MSDSGRPSGVERGVSEVNGPQRRVMTTKDKLLIAGIVTITALGFIWFNAALRQKAPPLARAAAVAGGGEQYTPPPTIQPAKPTDASLPMPAASAPSDSALAQKQSPETAPILAFSGGSAPASRILNAVPSLASLGGSGEAGSQPPAPAPAADGGALAQKLKPTVLSGATASVIKNPDMVVTEGTLIPCILQTAIDTQLAGFVTCVVPIDVRGTSGNVVLLDRGTKIVGQIQAGLVQGQERVFVLWTRAETPKHVVISLNAPGADELGRSGLPGAVENHWWQRFGGALMLTLVQGSLNAGTALAANSGGGSGEATAGFVYGAQSSGQQVANTALENTINIPPTLRKNQGDTVSVFVAQDLDFGSVYDLRISNNARQ